MTIEEELSSYILSKYRSIREFTIEKKIPYSTLATAFKRGINNTNWHTLLKICNALDISADDLADGRIVPRNDSVSWQERQYINAYNKTIANDDEQYLIMKFRALNTRGKKSVLDYVDLVSGNPAMVSSPGTET